MRVISIMIIIRNDDNDAVVILMSYTMTATIMAPSFTKTRGLQFSGNGPCCYHQGDFANGLQKEN